MGVIESARDILGDGDAQVPQDRRRVASTSNPLLMRLRLAALLIVGHKDYPDALSRITPMQGGIFALFDAIRLKTERVMDLPIDRVPPGSSRYFMIRDRYADKTDPAHVLGLVPQEGGLSQSAHAPRGGLAQGGTGCRDDPNLFYGMRIFQERYLALSQSFMGEGRKEYLSGVEEKSVHLGTTRPDDLTVPKPSLYELITGREKPPGGRS